MEKTHTRLIIICCIVVAYMFFVTIGSHPFKMSATPNNHYAYLTQGFLKGHLSLSISPPAELLSLSNPYDPKQNSHIRWGNPIVHDISFYHEKYYLYFGPLPAMTFFIPFKLLTAFYPSESLAVFFFLSLGFIVGFCLLIKIKEKYFPALSELQLILAGLLLGFNCNSERAG